MSQMECKICNKVVSGPVPYMDHIKSAKHLKKEQDFKMLQAFQKREGDSTDSSEPPAVNATPGEGLPDTIRTPVSVDHLAVERNPSMKHKCEICLVWMNSAASLQAHYQGKKHQKAKKLKECIQKVGAQNPLVTSFQAGESTKNLTQSGTTASANGEGDCKIDLSCDCCGILLFRSIEFKMEHLETEGHRLKKAAFESTSTKSTEDSEEILEPKRKKLRLLSSDDDDSSDEVDHFAVCEDDFSDG